MDMQTKKLTKSRYDRKLCGVCGGFAEYLNVDVTVVRLLWAILAFAGCGVVAYIVAAIIMPEE